MTQLERLRRLADALTHAKSRTFEGIVAVYRETMPGAKGYDAANFDINLAIEKRWLVSRSGYTPSGYAYETYTLSTKGKDALTAGPKKYIAEEQERHLFGATVKEKTSMKKAAPKKKTTVKKKAITRVSQATRKPPTKRLVARRKKTASGPKGYFANPIKGAKAIPLYAAYIEHEEIRYYYGGSKPDGTPIFDSDIKKAFLSGEKTPLANHMKAETAAHLQKSGHKIRLTKVYFSDGEVIPGA